MAEATRFLHELPFANNGEWALALLVDVARPLR
jgi:hypothetical protein